MSSQDQNLSTHSNLPSGKGLRFGVVVSQWNKDITESLFEAAKDTFLQYGVQARDIIRLDVPGSFELTYGAASLARTHELNALVCLGCIITGETIHNEVIAHAVAQGITSLNLSLNIPVIFGVLTPNTLEQARERAGGALGNKGVEAAATALQMALMV